MRKMMEIFKRDIRRIGKSPAAIIVAVGMCIIPALYAWFNIAANRDPDVYKRQVPDGKEPDRHDCGRRRGLGSLGADHLWYPSDCPGYCPGNRGRSDIEEPEEGSGLILSDVRKGSVSYTHLTHHRQAA